MRQEESLCGIELAYREGTLQHLHTVRHAGRCVLVENTLLCFVGNMGTLHRLKYDLETLPCRQRPVSRPTCSVFCKCQRDLQHALLRPPFPVAASVLCSVLRASTVLRECQNPLPRQHSLHNPLQGMTP